MYRHLASRRIAIIRCTVLLRCSIHSLSLQATGPPSSAPNQACRHGRTSCTAHTLCQNTLHSTYPITCRKEYTFDLYKWLSHGAHPPCLRCSYHKPEMPSFLPAMLSSAHCFAAQQAADLVTMLLALFLFQKNRVPPGKIYCSKHCKPALWPACLLCICSGLGVLC